MLDFIEIGRPGIHFHFVSQSLSPESDSETFDSYVEM